MKIMNAVKTTTAQCHVTIARQLVDQSNLVEGILVVEHCVVLMKGVFQILKHAHTSVVSRILQSPYLDVFVLSCSFMVNGCLHCVILLFRVVTKCYNDKKPKYVSILPLECKDKCPTIKCGFGAFCRFDQKTCQSKCGKSKSLQRASSKVICKIFWHILYFGF